jgi:hypothetical protein
MACRKCEQAGRTTKTLHYQKGGRWETRFTCTHQTEVGALTKVWPRENTGPTHTLSRHQVDPIKKNSRLPPGSKKVKHTYSEEEDKFILANYSNYTQRHAFRGQHLMQKMLVEFERLFGRRPTANQMVGRYNRLNNLKKGRKPMARQRYDVVVEEEEVVRGVPSLPVLKFMQDAGSDHA